MTIWNELKEALHTRKKVTLTLVALNILVFLILELTGSTQSTGFMLEHGACYAPYVAQGEYYRLLSSMFLHFSITHLVYNMICLYSMGDMLERLAGSGRFAVIYLAGGLAGNLASVLWESHTGVYAVSAGASGAVFAVIGALLYLAVRPGSRFNPAFTKRLAVVTVLMIAQGFIESGTDNAAHIGGVAAGFVLCAVLTVFGKR